MLIPRIFHQIWVGSDPFPEEFAAYQQSWLHHHPGWKLRFWTEESLPKTKELRRPEAAERLRAPWERADIFRLEIVWRYGGVHIDCDFECLRSIEPLIENVEFFIGLAKPGRVNGAIFGAVAGHPILDRGLEEIRPRSTYGTSLGAGEANDKTETGPQFLDRLLGEYPDVTYIEAGNFFPRTLEQRESAYAFHHKARSWKDADGLRVELTKLEKQVRERQAEASEWKERYKRAQAELGRPRIGSGSSPLGGARRLHAGQ